MQHVTLQNGCLTVVISSLGAEIQSIRDAQGVERIWQGDPKFWTGRAPILFPVAGGLKDDAYLWQGKRYEMPKHGFVRKIEWQVEKAEAEQAVFLTTEKHAGFPFDYELRAIFTLKENQLDVAYAVTSRNEGPFCISVGAHEAFATPGGIEDYEIVYEEEETLAHSLLVGNLNTHETQLIAEHTRVLPLRYSYFAVDALVFRSLRSRGVTLRCKSNPRTIRVDFPDHPILMLWDKPGAEYICIEPWCNGPDFVDAPAQIDQKFGFMRIEKGETIVRHHVITVG